MSFLFADRLDCNREVWIEIMICCSETLYYQRLFILILTTFPYRYSNYYDRCTLHTVIVQILLNFNFNNDWRLTLQAFSFLAWSYCETFKYEMLLKENLKWLDSENCVWKVFHGRTLTGCSANEGWDGRLGPVASKIVRFWIWWNVTLSKISTEFQKKLNFKVILPTKI